MTAPAALEHAFSRAAHVVSRRVAGECILVPLASRGADIDAIYDLNAIGAFIWEQLDGSRTGTEVVRLLTEAFEVHAEQAAADYLAFVEQLEAIGVICRTPA
jgi:Coenzyme PQQ synthesis protein D (PqqD)